MACRCGNLITATLDTPTADITGDGSPANPLQVDVIVDPFNHPHPVFGFPVNNGTVIVPGGLQSEPDRQVGFAQAEQLAGALPPILADTAGVFPWGAQMDVKFFNWVSHGYIGVWTIALTFPRFSFVLEPGASVEISWDYLLSPVNGPPPVSPFQIVYTNTLWRFENIGVGVQTTMTPHFTKDLGWFTLGPVQFAPNLGPPFVDFQYVGFQLNIVTTGFTGASSVTVGVAGSGFRLNAREFAF